ncbi:MAG TPA: imidazole glycerol phosphate synthase subunit HisH [Anaerolinea thermolimosa]|uniref:Imidazole glycerol phosphate synthase subunit HisH n=1 Tax=Anaerolinea thermolimosa TaxID=229919 RepID=A0A3D1JF31_9CHLR|nr:imidazole glycerol phosphate synthase subunit HisH [Anaerolinea thermolimosa]GAP07233.1 imidazole glycerol phosphate synthase, glutamine amidotransferase subunit [Anaerolinea thermolimosa]HCE17201.1 imidazole glycerol phosphate synthase subunit HisH [Anaerolinea thermolimosa]
MNRIDAILIDAGTGNLHSVHHALQALGYRIHVTSDPHDLQQGGRVILPGVGAFGAFMQGLKEHALDEVVREVFQRGDPLFGICVGMQAFFESSAESGDHPGLGLLPGRVVRFPAFNGLKIPHTGWNQLHFTHPSPLFTDLESGVYVYFNHSYFCDATPPDVIALTDYGLDYCSAVQHGNLFGVQFHPEKSQKVGRRVLENFFKI